MSEVYSDEMMDQGFEDYRDFMYQSFSVISSGYKEFIKDTDFSTKFKLERVQEMLDFFILEDEYSKCEELMNIRAALEVRYMAGELYQELSWVE